MANQAEVELAKRLLSARVLDEDGLRAAFDLQRRLHDQGKTVALARVLYHLKLLPPGSLDAATGPSPLECQPFPGYELSHILGEGGSSTVYGGTYLENGSPVAVKVMRPVLALRPDFVDRFEEEARLLIELENEHIILGYEVGEAGGFHYFSMEPIEGLPLLEVIDRRQQLTNEEALSVTLQTARALGALHAAGFLHRDVKPSNIMVEQSGRAVMIDLGLIHRLDAPDADDETSDETTVGTVEYLSPEQARGRRDIDPRSDIYSLGVSLYHMVVGDVPFSGESDFEVMAKQVLAALDAQKVKTRRIAPEVQFFITKMMSKSRGDRFETVADVVAALEGYVPELVEIDLGAPPVAKPVAPAPGSQAPVTPIEGRGVVKGQAPVRRRSSGELPAAKRRGRSSGELPAAPRRGQAPVRKRRRR